MKPEARKFHLEVLAKHKQNLFDTLIYEYNIVSKNLKFIEFKDFEGDPAGDDKGYFARKDNHLYWLNENVYNELPVRIGDSFDELIYNENLVKKPLETKPFRITPESTMKVRDMIDSFAPFEHSEPDHWRLMKIIGFMGYIGKTFLCVSSKSNFGKSGMFELFHGLTDKCPVFKPRSVPGVLNKITGTGNMIFDEVHECAKEVKAIMEEFSLQIGGNKPTYINGAMKSGHTRNSYNCPIQSITYLYNNVSNYKKPEKEYFEVIFSNNKAIDDRFLKVKLSGELTEEFDRGFSIIKEAEDNKTYYINLAKQLDYLQMLKLNDGYKRRFETKLQRVKLSGRKKRIFEELSWLIDMYCKNKEEYNAMIETFEEIIMDYDGMIVGANFKNVKVKHEKIKKGFKKWEK